MLHSSLLFLARRGAAMAACASAAWLASAGQAQTLVRNVPLGCNPSQVAVNSVTNKVYAVCITGYATGQILVMDGATDAVATIPVNGLPVSLAVNPASNLVLVVTNDTADNNLIVLDGATNQTLIIPLGTLAGSETTPFPPRMVAVNPATGKFYAAILGSGSLVIVNPAKNSVNSIDINDGYNTTITAPSFTLDQTTGDMYLLPSASGPLLKIDGASDSITSIQAPGSFLSFSYRAAAYSVATRKLYVPGGIVSNGGLQQYELLSVNGATAATAAVPIPSASGLSSPLGLTQMAADPVSGLLYATDGAGNGGVIDMVKNTGSLFPVGLGTLAIDVDAAVSRAYFVNSQSNTVTGLNTATHATSTINVGKSPSSIAINTATHRVYVGNSADGTISVIAGPEVTVTTLSSSSNPQSPGKAVTFTARVHPDTGSATPTGYVTFLIDGKTVATVATAAGQAEYTTSSLKAGAHTVKASYAGASGFAASSSTALTETIEAAAVTPVITPAGGSFGTELMVTLATTTPKTTIYYTVNGAVPTAASARYTAPFAVSASETVEAMAVATGLADSPAAKATFTLIGSPTVLTGVATNVTASGATLTAAINDQDASAQVWFLWGASAAALSSSTAKSTLGAAVKAQQVGAALTNLQSKKTYYFQPVVKTLGGVTYGAVQSFTTH